jgi:uncharacterized membrane protein YeaQ/YmgE (transglycosylase-associated protein family)
MAWLWYIIVGGIAGWVGSLLFKGSGSGIIVNIILGIVGGWLGGWLLSKLGVGGTLGPFITAVIGAFLLQWIAKLISGR